MSSFEIIFCPDCGLFYMKDVDKKTKQEKYTYMDSTDFSEVEAKNIAGDLYQCGDCGTVFELDEKSVNKTKSFFKWFRGSHLSNMKREAFIVEFINAFGVEPTEEQLKAFIDYMTERTNDVSVLFETQQNTNISVQEKQK